MTSIDLTQIPTRQLRRMLTAWAAGHHPDEAALALLANGCGGVGLRRHDFLAACVDAVDDGWTSGLPLAAVRWEDVPRFLTRGVTAPAGAVNVLRAAASLMGADVGALRDITRHLDGGDLALVLDAIAHRAGWHEYALTHTVTGHLSPGPQHADTVAAEIR